MLRYQFVLGLVVCGCGVEAADTATPDSNEALPGNVAQSVIKGVVPVVNKNTVAIYTHARNDQGQEGWRSMCSCSYLESLGGYSLISTAMHCVAGEPMTHPWDPNYV